MGGILGSGSWQKIKNEIINNPGIYGSKSPAEIACLLSRKISRVPAEYNIIKVDLLELLKERLTPAQKLTLRNWLIAQGVIVAGDLADTQVEIQDTVYETLGLPPVEQGDIEIVLKL